MNTAGVVSDVRRRVRVSILGTVQGVGFRPFVFRMAAELGLTGWVLNSSEGVTIEAEGDGRTLDVFLLRIQKERPENAVVQKLEWSYLPLVGFETFEIRQSDEAGEKRVQVPPDLSMCTECAKEIGEPGNRRHRYPFTNCTACGPRFSIIEALPYDRSNTTMRRFTMCAACRQEFDDPSNRRFHAQPIACHACGPHLELWNRDGKVVDSRDGALLKAADAIRNGAVVALKGLGGFQLIVDARNDAAVRVLRRRKHRDEKPFAVMFPTIGSVKDECDVSDEEQALLFSPASPIVLIRRRREWESSGLSSSVAPDNPLLGVMIPYTPLHSLLLSELGFPVVATSGNLSEEPICFDEKEALERLSGMADLFLVHDRPIARSMDDSVMRVVLGRPLLIRCGRGVAPLSIPLDEDAPPILAVGGHMKNTVAVTAGPSIFMSQHVGDLDSPHSSAAFLRAAESLENLYHVRPREVTCDRHPDYFSTRHAERLDVPCVRVQHHHAHVAACLADNNIKDDVLGIAWDGSGYGSDGTIWGGEFLLATRRNFKRVGSFRLFPLPGAEKAIREPRRSALGLLHEVFGNGLFERPELQPLRTFSTSELRVLQSMLRKRVNTPLTSSVGRLFDAVASIAGLRQTASFEGQAAMALEFCVNPSQGPSAGSYSIAVERKPNGVFVIDWAPMIVEILSDLKNDISLKTVSARFHNTLIEGLVDVAKRIGKKNVVLSGGCFQNAYLLERAVGRLRDEQFDVYWPKRVPPNDGGLSIGQAMVAASCV